MKQEMKVIYLSLIGRDCKRLLFKVCLTNSVNFGIFAQNIFPEAECTLMEDPEERLEAEILNGVALRPRVNSKKDTEKI